jgi:hypothetical protein
MISDKKTRIDQGHQILNSRKLVIEAPDDRTCQILKQKTEAERLAIASGLWTFASDMIRIGLKQEHPDWTKEDLDKQVAHRMSHGAV